MESSIIADIAKLPGDLLEQTLANLDSKSLLSAYQACSDWQQIASRDSLWYRVAAADFQRSANITGSRSASSGLGCPASQPFAEDCPEGQPALPATTGGLRRYREKAEVERNWRAGRCAWASLQVHRDYIRCAQLQGGLLAACSGSYMHRDISIRVWDVESGQCKELMIGHQGPIWSMQFDGRRVAACDDMGTVRLWDCQSHRVGVAASLATFSLKCISLDAAGQQMVAAGESGLLGLWSLDAIQEALDEQRQPAGAASTADDGLPSWQEVLLETTGVRPSMARPPQPPSITEYPADASCVQVDGGLCASGHIGPPGGVHLWQTAGNELSHSHLLATPSAVTTLSFQRGTGWLLAGCGTGVVRMWDLQSGTLLRDLSGHTSELLCHQQAGSRLATGAADRTVRLWDLRCGGKQAQTHVMRLASLPYSLQMDDRRLAVGCGDGTVQVADLRLGGGTAQVEDLKVVGSGPDGQLVPRKLLPVHYERVWALAMSDSRLISAALDSEVVVRSFHPDHIAQAEAEGSQQYTSDGTHVAGAGAQEQGIGDDVAAGSAGGGSGSGSEGSEVETDSEESGSDGSEASEDEEGSRTEDENDSTEGEEDEGA